MTTHSKVKYENNPFFIGLHGLQLLFRNAQSVGIFAAVLVGIGVFFNTVTSVIDTVNNMDQPQSVTRVEPIANNVDFNIFGLLLVLGFLVLISVIVVLLFLLPYSVLEYSAAQLALGKKVTLKQAISNVWRNLLGYFWVYIIVIVKLFLWTLLLIVPGIIMAIRYTLAGTVFFAENKRGNAAVKRSAELTKGAWFTTFAGHGLWNLITFGQITPLITPSANAILYRQLKDVTDRGAKKPNAHWLSWLTFFGPIVLSVILIGFFIMIALAIWLTVK